jgi:hypothetical protein
MESKGLHLLRLEEFVKHVWTGLLASGSTYFPRLPVGSTVAFAGFVPGYSGGTATDSHRLPLFPDYMLEYVYSIAVLVAKSRCGESFPTRKQRWRVPARRG